METIPSKPENDQLPALAPALGWAPSLLLGDCLERMAEIPDGSVDMVLCDLPYGTTACKWDSVIPFGPLWAHYRRVCKRNAAIVLTASQPFTSQLCLSNPEDFKYEIIWHKTRNSHPFFANKRPLPQHENVLVFCRGQHTYNPQKIKADSSYRINLNTVGRTRGDEGSKKWTGESKEGNERFPNSVIQISNPSREAGKHPTQKPVALMEYLIRTYTQKGDMVLDNAMGSGTTCVACVKTGRRFIGIERDIEYFSIAQRRIKEAYDLTLL